MVWVDIVPGEPRKPIPYTLTESDRTYCKRSARITLFSKRAYARPPAMAADRPTLVHPPDVPCTPATTGCLAGHRQCRQSELQYPARPTTITLQARALDKFIKRERLFVVHDNVFFNQKGDVICSGRGWTIRPM